ncbi:MAG: TonB-dependent siderophore receptor [Cyanobacteria bacterium P01_H01_bin.162]
MTKLGLMVRIAVVLMLGGTIAAPPAVAQDVPDNEAPLDVEAFGDLSGTVSDATEGAEPAQTTIVGEELTSQSGPQSAESAIAAESADSPQDVAEMPSYSEMAQSATTVEEWLAQIEASLTQITGVQIEETATGLQIMLETAEGELATPATQTVGNALIADIPNAVLALPEGESFEQFAPAAGIALVQVTNEPGDQVRVAITGTDAPPVGEVTATGLAVTLGEAVADAEEDAIQVVVTGEVGTRTETALRDVPQAIQVIPQPVIEEQNALQLGEILRNASGVVTTTGRANEGDGVFIRGFGGPFNSSFLRNGIRDENGQFINADPVNIERVEILKGPASVLFGEVAPGGTVNIITKRPLSEPFYEVEATVGSFDFYRGAIDLTGPLNESGSILYRLNAAAQTSDSFVDFFDEGRYFISPILTFRIGDRTELTLEIEYQETNNPGTFGIPASGTVIDNPNGDLPLDLFTGEPDESRFNLKTFRFGYDLTHRFNDNWQIRNAFQLTDRDADELIIAITGFQPDDRTADRFYFESLEPFSGRTYALDTYVTGEFSTGSIQHELVVGFELARLEFDENAIFGDAAPLDLFDPVYGQPFGVGVPSQSLQTNDSLGIYFQDQIDLTDNLILLLGGRFDIVNQTIEDFVADSRAFQQDEAFSPRIGIVYQPIEPISLYASYSQSFQQVTGGTIDNIPFEPERGTQYEIGVKADITDRLFATLALYDLTRTNIRTDDPNNPLFSVQSGEQRSRGVELDVIGEILPGWNIIAGYAYNDARVTEDNTFEEGNRLAGAPEHSFNLWSTYEIQEGNLEGLGFGLGLFFVGDREGDLSNSFELPSYLRTDAAIYYQRDQFNAAINFKNLFDVDYFSNSINQFRLYPGEPFSVQASVSWEF